MWKIMKENLEDLLSPNLWRSVACEMTGTLVIVLMGCGTWITSEPMAKTVQVALAFGLSVATMVWVFAHISGGHFNPALTSAMVVTRQVSIVRGVLYVLAQMVGGILGAGILYGLSPEAMRMTLGVTHIVDGGGLSQAQGFGVELLITLVFVLAFFASRDRGRSDLQGSHPLTVGLAVVTCHLFAINYTGAGMNCARSFGPAVIMNTWDDHWIYWVGPITGGLLGGLLYHYVFSEDATVQKTTKCLLRTKKPPSPKPAAAAAEKPPLEGDGAAPEVIEIDENVATAPLAGNENEAAAETEVMDSDKVKLTEAPKE